MNPTDITQQGGQGRGFRAVQGIDQGGRDEQQDAVGAWQSADGRAFFAVVADGAGGHGGGAEAAAAAVAEARLMFEAVEGHPEALEDGERFLSKWMERAHQRVNRETGETFRDARTVVAALLIFDGRADWVHAGDCRVYHFREGRQLSRTRDDSVVQVLFEQGEITEAEMGTHEDQNRLLQALGGKETPKPRLGGAEIGPDDVFLLCSDGFWENLDPEEIAGVASSPRSAWRSTLNQAVKVAVERGGHGADNTSALLVGPGGGQEEARRGGGLRNFALASLAALGVAALGIGGWVLHQGGWDLPWAPPKAGMLLVESEPAGAKIRISGDAEGFEGIAGVAPFAEPLPPGRYRVEASYRSWPMQPPREVEVVAGEDVDPLRFVFEPVVVRVESEPAGAEVFQVRDDGAGGEKLDSLGRTPLMLSGELEPGKVELVFQLDGYESPPHGTSLRPGDNETVSVSLEASPVSVRFTSVPEGAEVFLGEDLLGETPMVWDLMPDHHEVTARYGRQVPQEHVIEVVAGAELLNVDFHFFEPVAVRVESEPAGARVSVVVEDDGTDRTLRSLRTTPTTLSAGLEPGPVELEFELEGYQSVRSEVELVEGNNEALSVELGAIPIVYVEFRALLDGDLIVAEIFDSDPEGEELPEPIGNTSLNHELAPGTHKFFARRIDGLREIRFMEVHLEEEDETDANNRKEIVFNFDPPRAAPGGEGAGNHPRSESDLPVATPVEDQPAPTPQQ